MRVSLRSTPFDISSSYAYGWKPAIVWDPDDDSCNQLDCLLLACKQFWLCMDVGVAVTSQDSHCCFASGVVEDSFKRLVICVNLEG